MKEIKELDEVMTWLAKTGKLTGGNLIKVQRCLLSVAEEYEAMQERDIEHDATVSRLNADIAGLKSLLRCSGYTEKAIWEALLMGDDFLDKELTYINKEKLFIDGNTGFELLRSYRRSYGIRIEVDIINLRFYKRLLEIASESLEKSQKIKPHIQFLRNTYAHLVKFFDMADEGEAISEESIKKLLYTYYMNN